VYCYSLISQLAKDSLTAGNIPHCPCMICLEHFQEEDKFTKTVCYHYFHETCLARYVSHVMLQTPDIVPPHTQLAEVKQNKVQLLTLVSYNISFLGTRL